jgi:hypothetical protein
MSITENTDSRQQKITSHFYDDYECFYDDFTSIDTEAVVSDLLNMTDEQFAKYQEQINDTSIQYKTNTLF